MKNGNPSAKGEEPPRGVFAFVMIILVNAGALFFLQLINGMSNIFLSSSYHSWVEDILLGSLYCICFIVAYIVALGQYNKLKMAKFIGSVLIVTNLTGCLAYFGYHFYYRGKPQILGFLGDLENVTPFHVQFGHYFFGMYIFFALFLLFLKPIKSWLKIGNFMISAIGLGMYCAW